IKQFYCKLARRFSKLFQIVQARYGAKNLLNGIPDSIRGLSHLIRLDLHQNSELFDMQTQACHQVMDEAEKEYKKFSERITESREAMKASYDEFMAEAQASASRLIVVMASHCYLVGSSGELFIEYLVRHCALTDNNRGDLDILNKRVE
ncbi:hypothetical protein S245_070450, partial [Arachis hypogaea]